MAYATKHYLEHIVCVTAELSSCIMFFLKQCIMFIWMVLLTKVKPNWNVNFLHEQKSWLSVSITI
jgi:hypothetical protein